ncbi:MAG: MipA/OmpV family protein [Burkholderiales bacterium]|nr:MipA/OmpV family protein [Burkholderiales bacterium]
MSSTGLRFALRRGIVAGACLAAGSAAWSQDSTPLPLWEVGLFALGASQQAYPGAAQQLDRGLLLPYLIYRGEVLRVDRGGIGLRKVVSPSVELDIGFSGAFGTRSGEIDARQGMLELGTLVEFGPRIQWMLVDNLGGGRLRADFALRGVFDLNDHLSSRGLALEPELVFARNPSTGWRYSAGVGVVVGDNRLNDTLYGVDPVYATPTRAAYTASAGLIASRLSLYVSRALSRDLRLSAYTRIDSVAGAANQASPLVQKNAGASVGVWLTYTLARSSTLVRD